MLQSEEIRQLPLSSPLLPPSLVMLSFARNLRKSGRYTLIICNIIICLESCETTFMLKQANSTDKKNRPCPFSRCLQPVPHRFRKSTRQKLLCVHNNGEYCKSGIPSFSDVPRESSRLLETALSRMFEISPQLFCKD